MATTNANAGLMLIVRRAFVPYATGLSLMMVLPEDKFNLVAYKAYEMQDRIMNGYAASPSQAAD